MKTIKWNGITVEICPVQFYYKDETTAQTGILVHFSDDEFGDGDTLYGNGWDIDMFGGPDDIDSLLEYGSGDGTTYFKKQSDGTYRIEG